MCYGTGPLAEAALHEASDLSPTYAEGYDSMRGPLGKTREMATPVEFVTNGLSAWAKSFLPLECRYAAGSRGTTNEYL
jgi:hypothetical protein